MCCATSRSDEETHDHIGSISTTPSGVATPNPNPVDKRLPGILHSYFGQVRAQSSTSSSHQESRGLPVPVSGATGRVYTLMDAHGSPSVALPAVPASPNLSTDAEVHTNSISPAHQCSRTRNFMAQDIGLLVPQYPTPPPSSPASIGDKDIDSTFEGKNFSLSAEKVRLGKISRMGDDLNLSRPAIRRHQSGNDVMPLRTCQSTIGLSPLSNLMSGSSVHAAHLSNPATHQCTDSRSPTRYLSSTSALSSLASFLELTRLTNGVAALPRAKNTPPLTPRALSNDGIESPKKLPPSVLSPQLEDTVNRISHPNRSNNVTPTVSVPPNATAPVGPPKGKLSVKIVEARGLRPSHDPYVVCVFEWNESIARGPRREEAISDKDEGGGKEELFSGVPIKRLGNDLGKSMAIPMKSRQSSTTSLSDQKNFKSGRQLTNPRWEHEAVLYVEHQGTKLYLDLTSF